MRAEQVSPGVKKEGDGSPWYCDNCCRLPVKDDYDWAKGAQTPLVHDQTQEVGWRAV